MSVNHTRMLIYFIGVCGTAMGNGALLLREMGYDVVGSDENVYPPMSDLLVASGIKIFSGYDPSHINIKPDLVVIGNAISRGNSEVEYVLSERLKYTSLAELLKNFDVPVYRSPLEDKVFMSELDLELSVLTIPGHTLDHIAFVGLGGVFCGDTLFCAGCGRVFEGTYEQMFNALQLLSQLPDETKIYCGHEYTQKNVEFARAVEPRNSDLILQTHAPSTMGVEKLTNPFLRCDHPIVREAVEKYSGKKLNTPVEVFTELREWKNNF